MIYINIKIFLHFCLSVSVSVSRLMSSYPYLYLNLHHISPYRAMIRDLHQNPARRTLHHHLPTPPSSLHLQVRTSSAQRSNSIDTSYRAKAAKIDPSYRTKAAKLDSSYRTKSANQESSYRTEAKAARGRSREDIKPSKSVRIILVSISSSKYLYKSMKSRGLYPVPSSKVHPTGSLILPPTQSRLRPVPREEEHPRLQSSLQVGLLCSCLGWLK